MAAATSTPVDNSSSSSTSANENAAAPVDANNVWVFGYSSLCWNPGFTFQDSCIGYVKGYSRKFWQGSVSHRGTIERPGRVATLIEDESSVVWGRAFNLTPESSAFRYLSARECSNGGYRPVTVTVHPIGKEELSPFEALTYIAYPDNCLWLGDAPLKEIASQIVSSEGVAGHNAEYLLKLAQFMRKSIPEETDTELFALEKLVLLMVQRRKMSLASLMGGHVAGMELEELIANLAHNKQKPNLSNAENDFTHRVPVKKLRCVNI